MKDTSGPAFPALFVSQNNSTGETTMYQSEGGATLRDYFAAHAPTEPHPWFLPNIEKPTAPPALPVGNNGEEPSDKEHRELMDWRRDPCWDADIEHPIFSNWVNGWADHFQALRQYEIDFAKARYIQWPYAWADEQLKERDK